MHKLPLDIWNRVMRGQDEAGTWLIGTLGAKWGQGASNILNYMKDTV